MVWIDRNEANRPHNQLMLAAVQKINHDDNAKHDFHTLLLLL
jgi:hypothetical protein